MQNSFRNQPWLVLKFGGSSVGNPDNWSNIVQIVEQAEKSHSVLVVLSALKGVTNLLESVCAPTLIGERASKIEKVYDIHMEFSNKLGVPFSLWEQDWRSLKACLNIGEGFVDPELKAKIMAHGEVLSTRIGSAYLTRCGIKANWLDAKDVLETESKDYLNATCKSGPSKPLKDLLSRKQGVWVTQGFIARGPDGEPSLLGRGGSDTSAAIFGSMLSAARVEIWTDVPGVFTANPNEIKTAHIIRELKYENAESMAKLGAKVLHPRSIEPVKSQQIPIVIKSTREPRLPGTVIKGGEDIENPGFHAVTSRDELLYVSAEIEKGLGEDISEQFSKVFEKNKLQIEALSIEKENVSACINTLMTPVDEVMEREVCEALGSFSHPRIDHFNSVSVVGHSLNHLAESLNDSFQQIRTPKKKVYESACGSFFTLFFNSNQLERKRLVLDIHQRIAQSECQREVVLC